MEATPQHSPVTLAPPRGVIPVNVADSSRDNRHNHKQCSDESGTIPSRQLHCFWTPVLTWLLPPSWAILSPQRYWLFIDWLKASLSKELMLHSWQPVMACAPQCRTKGALGVILLSPRMQPPTNYTKDPRCCLLFISTTRSTALVFFRGLAFSRCTVDISNVWIECKANHHFIPENPLKRWIRVTCLQIDALTHSVTCLPFRARCSAGR